MDNRTIDEIRDNETKLINENERLEAENRELKTKLELLENDVKDNYTRVPISRQVGISNEDFI